MRKPRHALFGGLNMWNAGFAAFLVLTVLIAFELLTLDNSGSGNAWLAFFHF